MAFIGQIGRIAKPDSRCVPQELAMSCAIVAELGRALRSRSGPQVSSPYRCVIKRCQSQLGLLQVLRYVLREAGRFSPL